MKPCQLLRRSYFIFNYLSSHILIPFLVGASENMLFPNLNILKHAMQSVIQNHQKVTFIGEKEIAEISPW